MKKENDILKQVYEWIDKNPDKELEFYCEEGMTSSNKAGLEIIDMLQDGAKTEDELIALIAKVQWYKKYVEHA